MTETKSLLEYYQMLREADWYYEYTDDHGRWKQGHEYYKKIVSIADESPDHRKLLDQWMDHIYSSGPVPPIPAE